MSSPTNSNIEGSPQATQNSLCTLSVYVQNCPGVLGRITLVFSRRGFNIESLVVSPANDGSYSTMTITASGAPKELQQIIKQLKKLVNVINAIEHKGASILEREIALIKVGFTARSEDLYTRAVQVVDHFKAHTIDLTHASMIVQVTGTTSKVNACVSMLGSFGIIEVIRSGKLLIKRGEGLT